MCKQKTLVGFGCFLVLGILALLPLALAESDSDSGNIANSDLSLLEISSNKITLEFYPPAGQTGTLEAELYELGGKLLAKVSRQHQGEKLQIELFAQVEEKDLANYYVRYRFDSGQPYRQRSLMLAGEILETTVLGQREFLAGSSPVIRVLVKDRSAGVPIGDAEVAATLTHQEQVIAKFTARTDQNGEVAVQMTMPDTELQNVLLKIEVTSKTAKDTIEETVQIRSALRTLLTTDKPLYQPGQTIHIRAMTLSQPSMKPLAEAEVIFEVEDAKGNKVFKAFEKTDAYGISYVDFILADEVNMGTYRVRALAAGMKEEKTVTVERYVLPKFKVNFTSDRSYYQPGELVKGEIQADYFFGKPVAGGKVEITCSKFDVAYEDFQVIEGKTDEAGHYTFEVRLPEHFVGQPLEAGNASAKFDIKVVDTADHQEKITKNLSVTASPIIVAAVPESGELIAGLENTIYIVTTYADSTPAACKVTWNNPADGQPVTLETDEGGFGTISVIPQANTPITLSLTARDSRGQTGQASVELKAREQQDDSILLRTDKSLYRVGEPVEFSLFSTRQTGNVYVDVIKDRQTYLTQTLELQGSQASGRITLDAALAGTVQINAYFIGRNGVIVRDRRLILVDPADDLTIQISSNSDTYLPGTEAQLQFVVTNTQGQGVASALGVIVVDEAVFALQEMQPGLEKVYFYLEKEIATPRYEIHGYELDQCIQPLSPLEQEKPILARRDTAARVLLASAQGVGDYPLHVNTFQRDNKEQAFQQKMAQHLMRQYKKIAKALDKFSKKHKNKNQVETGIDLDGLVAEGYLRKVDTLDPWNSPLKITGTWCQNCQNYHDFTLASAGIDGQWGTADDVAVPSILDRRVNMVKKMGGVEREMAGMVREEAFAMDAVAVPMAAMDKSALKQEESLSELASGPAEPIRIRQYFPETLYFNPAVITDADGRALLNVPLADSITTWRMTCMASSAQGQLGSTTEGIRVFQDFFVDIDFPISLTQNDQVHVPVAIFNYLKTDQQIQLQVQKEDWFELEGLPEKTITLAPSEVRAVYFPITARKIGFQKFTVTARGEKKNDAVARSVEIVPDGKETLVTQSGRLEGAITHTITIPNEAIDEASKIFVKVYPGVLSQVAEGLDSMLRMPFGCFEQTSSVTYPNILVLDYMKTTGKITPELQMKAEGFINTGYQRLVSYEVPGGGFEWFGQAPAHRILTAYGLMEFYDMSKVYEVDPALISRTQQWLATCQEKDGSYKPSEGGIQEGAINKFTDDVLRVTAYITWALAATEYQGPEVANGIKYIRNHLDDIKDVYTRVMVVNALAAIDPKNETTLDTLRTLHEMRVEKDDTVYWAAQSETPTCGTGAAADIEVTALAVQALIRCGQELGTVGKAVNFLVKNKDAYGTWQSTQATIQALRAMLMAERGATAAAEAAIKIQCNGEDITTLAVNDKNSDVLQLVDLKDYTDKGDNTITLTFEGTGALLYQIVGRFYLPYPQEALPAREEPMTIDLQYDRTELATDDLINVTATVSNNRPGRAQMVILDLGLPPGFTLIPDHLNQLVEQKVIEKYSTTGRQIIVYLREVAHGQPLEIRYQLLAKYPLAAKTPKSAAYEYYNPDIRVESVPIQLTVQSGPLEE